MTITLPRRLSFFRAPPPAFRPYSQAWATSGGIRRRVTTNHQATGGGGSYQAAGDKQQATDIRRQAAGHGRQAKGDGKQAKGDGYQETGGKQQTTSGKQRNLPFARLRFSLPAQPDANCQLPMVIAYCLFPC